MQINAYNNLFSSLPTGAHPAARTDKNDPADESGQIVELSKRFDRLIEQAKIESQDRSAVEQARRALADGTLESPEAFLSAAEHLLRLGI